MSAILRTAAEIGLNGGVSKRPSAPPRVLARPKAPTDTIAFHGINRHRGQITEEKTTELAGAKRVDVYDRMRNDGLIQALLLAVELPVMAASWVVEPAGKDANALRAAELVEENLMGRLGDCWESEVEKLLAYLQYGFQVSAENYKVENGYVVLDELRDLHPRTVLNSGKRWDFDDKGKLRGVWQYGNDGSTFREEYIPGDRMLLLTNHYRHGNPEGRSLLRAAWRHWMLKVELYIYDAIGHERGAVGVPYAVYPEGTPPDKQTDLSTFVENMATSETGFGVFPQGTEIKNAGIESKTEKLLESIHHHNAMMATSFLAQFLLLGQQGSQGGAYALSADQSDLFLVCLESVGDYLAARINRGPVRRIVDYNLATDQYPTVSATISQRSAAAMADLVGKLARGQNAPLTWGEADEDWLREYAKLPARTEPRPKRVEPQPRTPGQPAQSGQNAEPQQQSRRERIELQMFAEPASFREEPADPRVAELAEQLRADLQAITDTLRTDVLREAGLTAMELSQRPRRAPGRAQRFAAPPKFKLTEEQIAAIDAAIERWLTEFAGVDRSEEGFVGEASEDALIQSYLRLGHSVGITGAVEQLAGAQAAAVVTRNSPEIRRLLLDAFARLSKQGTQRIGHQIEDVRAILVDGATVGRNPLDVARDLNARFDAYARWEWERLARTEMNSAAVQGQVDEYLAAGVKRYSWLISTLACPICQAFGGKVYLTGQGPLPPRDSHPHCMCSVQPEVDTTA